MERNTRIEEELFPFYALDALTEEERAEVERYVADNPEAGARLAEMTAAALDFSAATMPVAPSPAVKAGLMARIAAESTDPAQTPQPRPASARPAASPKPVTMQRRWWERLAPAVGAFAVLALLLSVFAVWRLSGQVNDLTEQIAALEQNTGALQAQVSELEGENEVLRQELSARDDMLALFSQPGAVTIAIGDATGDHPAAVGTLTMDPAAESATLQVANLPPTEAGSTYQAWLIVGDTPHSVGLFTVDENGAATHTITAGLPDSFDAVGVSMEPEGGSDTPTPGNIILLGSSF
jgi:anti-sigma-K factor RskA